ncbi:hypothetical protein RCG17_10755 [Neobacillus sp. PS3-12]|jgi:hypothetical protein|uniref:hypothetical protein n=1 Tax=Neobacillus sp. PS3-12 TaxID=3070677 RepID=UPI0027E07F7D|nr:hypothetical protein [Neobacillus sp. PS3-12]WML55028.1 hypothetical protein RCG17_10755 [Neobacillus sp. PS3-12]
MSPSSRETILEVLSSVAHIENALADAITVQTRILSKGNFKAEQLETFTDNLIKLVALSIRKELAIDIILQDIIQAAELANNPQPK